MAAIHTLQMLHLFPTFLGPVTFFQFDFFGALMWGILFLIDLWVFRMLWNVDQQGWLFMTVISTLNLILDVLSILGSSTWSAMAPSILINGIILIYCLLPGTKAAFAPPAANPPTANPPTAKS